MSVIQIENRGRLRIITINNIKKRNALNKKGYVDLTKALKDADKDDSVSVVAVTGSEYFFSSGNDLKAAFESQLSPDVSLSIAKELVRSFYTNRKILIAVVNGPCIGIATSVVALCDVIYAEKNAYFHTPFTSLGLCAEACSSWTFTRIMGKSKANEMLFLNHKMFAEEALRFNFVSELFAREDLDTKIWPKIEDFAKLPHKSLMITKELMKRNEIQELDAALAAEIEALKERLLSDDCKEATMKFMQRKSGKASL